MKLKFIIFLFVFSVKFSISQTTKETITFKSVDNVIITSDLYLTTDKNAPFIILFHQAMFSRGEYIEIAPELNKLGYNCMAVDQRSGLKVNGVENQTNNNAKKAGKNTKYPDAYPDLEASLQYIQEKYSPKKLIVWGSSYSSSLVLILAAKHKEINAVLSFSPGDYFKFEDKTITDWATEVKCPVFITSSQKESEDCSLIFKHIKHEKSIQYSPDFTGNHGSKALWTSNEGHEHYWEQVNLFLEGIE